MSEGVREVRAGLREGTVWSTWWFSATPPSANNLYSNAGQRGRVKSKRYSRWLNTVVPELVAQRMRKSVQTPLTGKYRVSISVVRPSRRSMDIFNREKALSDALVHAGILADDSLIVGGEIDWDDDLTDKNMKAVYVLYQVG